MFDKINVTIAYITYKLYDKGNNMNKEKALKAFVDALKPYLLNVEFHECFIDELREILLKHKGCEATLLRLLSTQLKNLELLGAEINRYDGNEILKHMSDSSRIYYSLHMHSKIFNVRLIITFYEDKLYFLTAFEENNGKTASSYSKYSEIAISRFYGK
mgnify:CR=1 FL=1